MSIATTSNLLSPESQPEFCMGHFDATVADVQTWTMDEAASLTPHWACDSLPVRSDYKYDELLEDIESNGQQQPIIVANGKIIDGRHRLRALQKLAKKRAGIKVLVRDLGSLTEQQITDQVMSATTAVRHWSTKHNGLRKFRLSMTNAI
jgi:ParB-like nuclease domain